MSSYRPLLAHWRRALAPTVLVTLALGARSSSAQATDGDLVRALSALLGAVATEPYVNAESGRTNVLLQQTAAECTRRFARIWDSDRQLGQRWSMVGAATDAARQTRVYTVADPDGALWSVAVVAADMCLLELSGTGHRAPSDDWRLALPPLLPVDANPVELPW